MAIFDSIKNCHAGTQLIIHIYQILWNWVSIVYNRQKYAIALVSCDMLAKWLSQACLATEILLESLISQNELYKSKSVFNLKATRIQK